MLCGRYVGGSAGVGAGMVARSFRVCTCPMCQVGEMQRAAAVPAWAWAWPGPGLGLGQAVTVFSVLHVCMMASAGDSGVVCSLRPREMHHCFRSQSSAPSADGARCHYPCKHFLRTPTCTQSASQPARQQPARQQPLSLLLPLPFFPCVHAGGGATLGALHCAAHHGPGAHGAGAGGTPSALHRLAGCLGPLPFCHAPPVSCLCGPSCSTITLHAPPAPAYRFPSLHSHSSPLPLLPATPPLLPPSCLQTKVGSTEERGISGGERKRLTTAEILVGQQPVVFMGEEGLRC